MTSDSRFKKRSRSERLENVRSERATAVPEEPKLVFNFKDFDASQSVSQFFEAWQKGRVAGYVIGNVFYVVFLDQNHRFWVTEKKGT